MRQTRNLWKSVPIALAMMTLAGDASAEALTIEFAYSRPKNFKTVVGEVVKRFEAENPGIRISVRPPSRNYESLVQDMLRASMVGQDLPDVALHGLHRVRLLNERGLVVPLDSFMAAEPDWPSLGYLPAMQRLGRHDGRHYALSFGVSTMVVHYNLDLVEKAGGDRGNLPTTWPQMLALADKINGLGDDIGGIFWYYYKSNNNFTYQTLLQGFGGAMMSPDDREIAFDSPAGMRALNLVRDIGKAGMVDVRDAQAVQSFSAGKLGIYLSSSSRIGRLSRAAGDKFRYAAGPLPVPVASSSFPAGGAGLILHAQDPAKQRAAWEFIKFAAGPVGQTIMVRNTGYMPGNAIAIERPDLLGDFYAANPNYKAPILQLPRVSRFYTFPGENSIKIPTVIRDHLYAVVTLRRTPAEVMPDMVADVARLLPKN